MAAVAAAATGMPPTTTRGALPDFKNGFNNASLISTTTTTTTTSTSTSSSYPFVTTNRSTNASSSFNNMATATANVGNLVYKPKPTPPSSFNHSNLVSSNESLLATQNSTKASHMMMMQRASNLPIRKPPQPPIPSEASLSHQEFGAAAGTSNSSLSKRKPVLAESLIKKIQKITTSNQKPIVTANNSTNSKAATTTATITNTSNNFTTNPVIHRHQTQQVSKSTDSSRFLVPTAASSQKQAQMKTNTPPYEQPPKEHQSSGIQSVQHIQQPPAFASDTRTSSIHRRSNQVAPISTDDTVPSIKTNNNNNSKVNQPFASTYSKQKPSTYLTELNESSELSNPLTNSSSIKNKPSGFKSTAYQFNAGKRYSSEKNVQRMSTYIISSAHKTHNNHLNRNNGANSTAAATAAAVAAGNQLPKKMEKRLRFNLDESLRSNLSINDEQVKKSLETKSYNSYKKKKDFISANKQIDAYLAKNENRVKKTLERINKNQNEIKPLPGTKQTFNLKRSNDNERLNDNKLTSVDEEDLKNQNSNKSRFQQPRMRFNKLEHGNDHLRPLPTDMIIKTAASTNNAQASGQAYQPSSFNSNSSLDMSSFVSKSMNAHESELADKLTSLKPMPQPPPLPMTNPASNSLINHTHHSFAGQPGLASLQPPHSYNKLSTSNPLSLRHHHQLGPKDTSLSSYSKKYLDYDDSKLGPTSQANLLSRRYDTALNYTANPTSTTTLGGGNKNYRSHFMSNPPSLYGYGAGTNSNVPNRIEWVTPSVPQVQNDFNFYKPYRPMSPMRHLARLS